MGARSRHGRCDSFGIGWSDNSSGTRSAAGQKCPQCACFASGLDGFSCLRDQWESVGLVKSVASAVAERIDVAGSEAGYQLSDAADIEYRIEATNRVWKCRSRCFGRYLKIGNPHDYSEIGGDGHPT